MNVATLNDPLPQLTFDHQTNQLRCQGIWTTSSLSNLKQSLPAIETINSAILAFDGGRLQRLDSAGAWVLQKLRLQLEQQNKQVEWLNFSSEHQMILELVHNQAQKIQQLTSSTTAKHNFFYSVGKNAVEKWNQAKELLGFVGEVSFNLVYVVRYPKRIQWRGLLNTIDETGYRALPIIALLLFLIGIVLAYQMGQQLKIYGANVYIVDLTGLAMLQEFAPLVTAIIIAGRSGSAITAQLGSMKINEEIDALATMGLSPIDRLVIPKIIGLMIALPLLFVWADIFGMLGTMVMAKYALGINYYDFLLRFPQVISLSTFLKGISKAPVFAAIITNVACLQGFQVSYSADSVGKQTTKSVVQSIFLIIIADALFSIVYSWDL